MSAIFSADRKHRLRLDREIAPEGIVILYVGVNPSDAAEEKDDPTTKRWIGFSKILCARKYIAVNVFTYQTPHVRNLKAVQEPCDPLQFFHISDAVAEADLIIPCWGSAQKLPRRLRQKLDYMLHFLIKTGKPVKFFGLTKDMQPAHPLFLPYSAQLIDAPVTSV